MFHGLVLIDKPSDMTSHDVVNRARRILGTREVGHAGTLDPMASGLLVLLVGEATKISDHVLNENKAYQLKVQLGIRTDTLDKTGQVLTHADVNFENAKISDMAKTLVGSFLWSVPAFSAVKVAGQKLYELARKDQPIADLPMKTMSFWDLEISEVTSSTLAAHVRCSKGSYIRRWASELGERLECGAVLDSLRRTECSPYDLKHAVSLDQLAEIANETGIFKTAVSNDSSLAGNEAFVPLRRTLPGWRSLSVRGRDERLIHHGQISMDLERRLLPEKRQATEAQQPIGIKILSAETGNLLSLLEAQPNRGLKIRRVFKSLVSPEQNQ